MPDQDAPTIVLAIDGLRAAALGAYGQTGYETPAFDALAAESVVYDACYAATPDPLDLYRRLAELFDSSAALVTDQSLTGLDANAVRIETLEPTSIAESIEATAAAASWMGFAERLIELGESGFPDLLWIHTRGLYGPWDAPESLHEPLVDNDDPEVLPEAEPPEAVFGDSSAPEACDARFAAGCRYAGQVMALDACLAGWLDVLDGLFEGEDYRLIVLGLRGFPLGEHGQIGGIDKRLFSEQQHVPLLIRDGDPTRRFTREPAPVTLDTALLATLSPQAEPADHARLSSDTATTLLTDDWLLRRPTEGDPELYVKPDDRWEQNDIATRKEFVVEELLAELAGESGVAAPASDD